MQTVLVIGHGIPQPNATGAGVRMQQLLELYKTIGSVHFCSTDTVVNADLLAQMEIPYTQITLNCDSFNDFVKKLNPDYVVFDRFMTEEQYSWRVREVCPDAIRILDTEDLHFLRASREKNKGITLPSLELSDIGKRELAAIYRSDLSLIISMFEYTLLERDFGVPKELLYHIPFLVQQTPELDSLPDFDSREGLFFVGTGKHKPNVKAIDYLYNTWPVLKKALPTATIHIYGAYLPEHILALHTPKTGFHVMGRVENLHETIKKHRVLVAPLDFGAGQKRKVFDAWLAGCPVVTTLIGAEGIGGTNDFGGYIYNSDQEFLDYSKALYNSKKAWIKMAQQGVDLLNAAYNWEQHALEFKVCFASIKSSINPRRKRNLVGQILWHQGMQSTKYLSKWIAEKTKNN